jgi:hypothetical protein
VNLFPGSAGLQPGSWDGSNCRAGARRSQGRIRHFLQFSRFLNAIGPVLALAALTLMGATGGAAERQVPLPGTTLVLSVPDGFEDRADTGATLAWQRPGSNAGLAATVTELKPGTGPAAFAKERLDELLALGTGVTVIEHRFAYQVGVRTWSLVRYRMRIGQTLWEQALWLTVEDDHGVCIAGSADPATFARWLPLFERAVAGAGLSRPVLAPR